MTFDTAVDRHAIRGLKAEPGNACLHARRGAGDQKSADTTLPNRALPLVDCCFGTNPSQETKSGPRRKLSSTGSNDAIAITSPSPHGLRPSNQVGLLAAHLVF